MYTYKIPLYVRSRRRRVFGVMRYMRIRDFLASKYTIVCVDNLVYTWITGKLTQGVQTHSHRISVLCVYVYVLYV